MAKLFESGIPIRPDIERLNEAIEIAPGTSVAYEVIAEVIKEPVRSNRFEGVLAAWKKDVFRKKGIQIAREGEAVHFLTPHQALSGSFKRIRRIGRAVGKNKVYVDSIPDEELDEPERAKLALVRRESDAILKAVQQSAKVIALPGTVKGDGLPQLKNGDGEKE